MPSSIPPALTQVKGKRRYANRQPAPEVFPMMKALVRKLFFQKPFLWGLLGTPPALRTARYEMACAVAQAYAAERKVSFDEEIFHAVCAAYEEMEIPPRKGSLDETIAMDAAVIIHEYNNNIGNVDKERNPLRII